MFLESSHRAHGAIVALLAGLSYSINRTSHIDYERLRTRPIAIPIGNTTNVTLSSPVPAARYASLLIFGNQALDSADVEAKNGTGATVAEWAILGQTPGENNSSSTETAKRMNVRAAAALADSGSFMARRRRFSA